MAPFSTRFGFFIPPIRTFPTCFLNISNYGVPMNQGLYTSEQIANRLERMGKRVVCEHCGFYRHNSSSQHSSCSNLYCEKYRLQPILKPSELSSLRLYKLGDQLQGLPTAFVVVHTDYFVHPEARRSTGGGRYFRLSNDTEHVYRCVERFDISIVVKRRREVYSGLFPGVVAHHMNSVKGFGRFVHAPGRRLAQPIGETVPSREDGHAN